MAGIAMKTEDPPSLDHARTHYDEGEARTYDQRRARKKKWRVEHECLRSMLRDAGGSDVLDVPVGTGRFLGLYRDLGLDAVGVDANQSMLVQAAAKFPSANLQLGDAAKLAFADASFDVVVCVRLLHLITPAELTVVMAELFRVARGNVIVSAYLGSKSYTRGRQQVHTMSSLLACASALPGPKVAWPNSEAVKLLSEEGKGDYYMVRFARHYAVG